MIKLIGLLLILSTAAFAQQSPQPTVTLNLTQEQLQVVWAGLQELPGKYGDPVKSVIQQQVQSQAVKQKQTDPPKGK